MIARTFIGALAIIVVGGLAGPAHAQMYEWGGPVEPEIKWTKPSGAAEYDWNDPLNWADAVDIAGVPGVVGGLVDSTATFGSWNAGQPVTVNVAEDVNTGLGDIYVRFNSSGNDLTFAGTGSLTCSTFWVRQSRGYVITQVPLHATTMVKLEWRWGYGTFQDIVRTPLVRVGDGDFTFEAHDGNDEMDTAQLWYDRDSSIPEMYQYNAVDPYTPGTPFSITVSSGGVYGGYVDGAFGTLPGNTVDITAPGNTVIVGAAQTNFPDVVVGPASTLAGDMTGLTSADFGMAGDGKKVTFQQDSIYAPAPGGAEPTREAMGGYAILVKGIYDTAAAETTTLGDDGSTAVYYAAAFGSYGTSPEINTTVALLPDLGNRNLPIFVTGRNADLGALTGIESVGTQVADIQVLPGAGYVNLVGPINNGDLTSPNATTFNVVGKADAQENNWVFEISDAGGEIAVGQTFNVQNGMTWLNTGVNATFLKGTLEIGAGGSLRNGNTSTPLDATGGTISFQDRSLLFLVPGQEGMFENINVTESGTPFIVVATNATATYTYTINDGTEMGDLAKASNIWVSAPYNSSATTFAGDGLLMGDGKWMQTINSVTRDPKVAGIVRAEPGTTIGFASMGVERNRVFHLDANIDAAGATVLFNTTDALETSVFWSANTSGNHHTNNRDIDTIVPNRPVNVNGLVTAETIKVQNGPVNFAQDLNVPNLDIAAGATLTMANGMTATVTDTLSGNGTVAGGGIVVANGGTFAWEISDPDGVAGTDWNMLTANAPIDFGAGGTVMFSPMDIDMGDEALIEFNDEFIVATGDNLTMPGTWDFVANPGWIVGDATLVYTAPNLVLSNIAYTPATPIIWMGGDTGTWATTEAWEPVGPPLVTHRAMVETAGDYVIVDAAEGEVYSLDVTQGTVDVQATGALTLLGDTTVGTNGTLLLAGSLDGRSLRSEGTTDIGITGNVTLSQNATVAMGGSLNVAGNLTANALRLDGNEDVAPAMTIATGGQVTVAGNTEVDNYSTLTVSGSLATKSLSVAGSVTAEPGALAVSKSLTLDGGTPIIVTDGDGFTVSGANLADSAHIALSGGTISIGTSSAVEGAIAHWTFDEAAGVRTLADSSGSDAVYNGTIQGAGGFESDPDRGRVMTFNGADTYITLPEGFEDFSDQGITIAGWFKPADLTMNGRFVELTTTDGLYDIFLGNFGKQATFEIVDGTGLSYFLDGNNLEDNPPTWVHLAATQQTNGETVIYQDGVPVISSRLTMVPPVFSRNVNSIGLDTQNDTFYEGAMDDLYIFDRSLSAADVNVLFTGGPAGEPVNLLSANFSAAEDTTLQLNTSQSVTLGGLAADAGAVLSVDGDASSLTVNILSGSGTIDYDNALTVGSAVAPGGDTPGTLTVTGDVTMAAGSAFEVDFVGNAADRLNVGGTLKLSSEGEPQPKLVLKPNGGVDKLFKAGTYVIADAGLLDVEFATVEGLGDYLPEGNLVYADGELTATIVHDLHPGDADLNLTTDVRDFNVWNTNKFTSGTDWASGDFDGNGVTDVRDFNVWNTAKFTSVTTPGAPAVGGQVPEPGTLVLLIFGALGLLAMRRRR